jgi:putative ABC transport system ATP-binding protein
MLVSVSDLILRYAGNSSGAFTVLDIPKWQMAAGNQWAISGPSGSGKSTFLNTLAGLITPTSGTVHVCDRNVAAMGEAERDHFRARHIGYIFQTFNLLQGYTAFENVLVGMTFSRQHADRDFARSLLDRVGLSHRLSHYPAQMSIGEQQRVAIARALAKRPELILADEPTGSLDPRHSGEVVTLLQETCRDYGCSLLVVSHEQAVVQVFENRLEFLQLNRAFAGKEAAR